MIMSVCDSSERRPDANRVAARLIAENVVPDALVYTYGGEAGDDPPEADTAGTGAAVPGDTTADDITSDDITSDDTTSNDTAMLEAAEPDTATVVANTGAATEAGTDGATQNIIANADIATSSPGVTDSATQLRAEAGQRYLQVGAFVSSESAKPLRAELETLGLNVTRSEDATGLVRLFVGPLESTQLTQAQNRLNAAGIVGSFPVIR